MEAKIAAAVLFSFLLGALLAWLAARRKTDRIREERSALETRLAVVQSVNDTIPGLKADLAAKIDLEQRLHQELREITAGLAREKERAGRLETVTETLTCREQAMEAIRAQLAGRDAEIRVLRVRMEEERKNAEEKRSLLNEARSELANRFKVLAQEILDEKGRTFGEQSRAGLKNLLDPFRDQLFEFKQKVDSVYVHEATERASLKKEIEILRDLNRQMGQEAVNLTRALKGDKKAQGTWGEMILERVLEQSGLRKGIEYETQGGFRDNDGRLLKPDVIVHLPEEKDVVIDSKVSLVAYERYVNATEEDVRSRAIAEHVRAVRDHIDRLSGKDYGAVRGIRSLDFVLMFMPVEAAFMAAFRADENLFSHAFEKRIVVVAPTTLLATLKTIENIWRYERQNRNAQVIFERAGALYEKLRLFLESMEKLGRHMEMVHCTYEETMNRLSRGKGNVISQASRFSELGVAVKKPLPATITEIAEIEGPPPEDPPGETLLPRSSHGLIEKPKENPLRGRYP